MLANAESDRVFGLLLFEAEESLARGAPDKSLVLASKAVKERPESLVARSLFERARREILQGKRREKLEARLREAEALVAAGNLSSAERIITSALKLLPDHQTALGLLGRIRQERTRGDSAEAEAETELLRLASSQAHQAAAAARAALAQGWNRRAFLHIRRGLRQMPDHPELLALLRETQGGLEQLAAERTRRRALHSQIRDGLELLAAGDLEASLRILRAVLEEDPDNPRAQAAVQEVRQAWLRRTPASPPPPAPPPQRRPLAAPAPLAPPRRPQPAPAPASSGIPVEILLPRTRRRATPIGLVLGGAVVVLGALLVVAGHSGRFGPTPVQTPSATDPSAATPETTLPGPLANADPALAAAIRATLDQYRKALERADADLLAEARPDLSPEEREECLAPFVGALNTEAYLRVLDVKVEEGEAAVTILATYVVVDGRRAPPSPAEETLHFQRQGSEWRLRARRDAGGS